MIFVQLALTFLFIGAFTFGGGYAMVALINAEVVDHHGWLSQAEFTDLLAVSQATPGPIGINTATYVGYAAVINAGYEPWAAVCGALMASLAVVAVPVVLALMVFKLWQRVGHGAVAHGVMHVMRLAVVGIVTAAAVSLVGIESFGNVGLNLRFLVSVAIFVAVFALSLWGKVGPVWLIVAAGAVGWAVYGLCG